MNLTWQTFLTSPRKLSIQMSRVALLKSNCQCFDTLRVPSVCLQLGRKHIATMHPIDFIVFVEYS